MLVVLKVSGKELWLSGEPKVTSDSGSMTLELSRQDALNLMIALESYLTTVRYQLPASPTDEPQPK